MFDSLINPSGSINPLTPRTANEAVQNQWWIEIQTRVPAVVYYFGPFDTRLEAVVAQVGYRDDLMQENAQDIVTKIKYCAPLDLTICEPE